MRTSPLVRTISNICWQDLRKTRASASPGQPFVENGGQYDYRFTNIEHVSGQCQLFRRKCFDEIGGYMPIKGGGIDWVAVTTARMRGWETRTFTGKTFFHHRAMGTGNRGGLLVHFKQGQKDYSCGNHPLWEVFRAMYQSAGKPYILRGLLILTGYAWSSVRRAKRPIPGRSGTVYSGGAIEQAQAKVFLAGRKNLTALCAFVLKRGFHGKSRFYPYSCL